MQTQHAEPLSSQATTTVRRDFTSLEWLVIAIGAREGSAPLHWSRFGRAILDLFGISGGVRPLASPCLESLRVAAGLARRHGWAMPAAEVGAFLRGGWSEEQLEQLIESLGSEPATIVEKPIVIAYDETPMVELDRPSTARLRKSNDPWPVDGSIGRRIVATMHATG
jgi:hypothetical protein